MNTTQRKFTINRVYQISVKKLKSLGKQDKLLLEKYNKAKEIPLASIIKLHTAGKLKVKNLSIDTINKSTNKATLADVFDLTQLQKVADKNQAKLEVPMKSSGTHDPATKVTIKCNSNHEYNDYEYCYFRMLSVYERAIKLQAHYKQTCDEIMLGSNAEALAAISKMESTHF